MMTHLARTMLQPPAIPLLPLLLPPLYRGCRAGRSRRSYCPALN